MFGKITENAYLKAKNGASCNNADALFSYKNCQFWHYFLTNLTNLTNFYG